MQVWMDLDPRAGTAQMAIDEALLEMAREDGTSVLRLYRWRVDTVSFGAHEAANRGWHRERLEAANVPAVRRPTGGRAVWHAPSDLTYAITRPMPPGCSIRDAYRAIHQDLAASLGALGLDTALAPRPRRTPGLAGGACFDTAAGGEVLVSGLKTIGSAQLLRSGALLQHGAIARADPFERLAPFSREPLLARPPEAHNLLPSAEVIADAIGRYWQGNGATAADPELTQAAEHASLRYAVRYQSGDWTWRR